MKLCENCIHADVSHEDRVITQGNITIVQKGGGTNIRCTTSPKNLSFDVDFNMVCSDYTEKPLSN